MMPKHCLRRHEKSTRFQRGGRWSDLLWTENIYLQYVTRPVLSTQNAPIYIIVSISFSVCSYYTKSIIFIEFLRKFCVVFNLKDGKLGQILRIVRLVFSGPVT